MNFWRKEKNDFWLTACVLIYFFLVLCVFFHQNSIAVMGKMGIHNVKEMEDIFWNKSLHFYRIILVLPIGILLLIQSRYFLDTQRVIRQKSKKKIYVKLLRYAIDKSIFWAAWTICFLFVLSILFQVDISHSLELFYFYVLFFKLFGYFGCMSVLVISILWMFGKELYGIILLCAMGIYDVANSCYNIHCFIAVMAMIISFWTAGKKEFYDANETNDRV